MFGSYGSYSSMCAASQPIDIASGNLAAQERTCAFPSWPRRSSLSDSDNEERPTSFLSDDDLFLCDPFEDDARSISSSGTSTPPTVESPQLLPPVSDAELMERERSRGAMQKEFVRQLICEKERRKQAAKSKRRSSSSAKKSPKSKLSAMTPITEAGE